MISFTVYTEEIDFAEDALAQIDAAFQAKVQEIGGLRQHTAALVFADSETAIQEVLQGMADRYGFPVLAASTIVTIDKQHGHLDTGINIMFLTADDIEFAAAVSEDISGSDLEGKVEAAYTEATGRLSGMPGLIIAYSAMLEGNTGDDVLDALDKASGGVPVFGGQATGDFVYKNIFVAANSSCRRQGVAMLLLSGKGIANAFAQYEFSVLDEKAFEGVVTRCSGCTISQVDAQPVLQSLDRLGITRGKEGLVQIQYITTPFWIKEKLENGDELVMLRNLISIDRQAGTISLLGNVREGSRIAMVSASREAMISSMQDIIGRTARQVRERGLNTLLVTSCLTRYMAMGPRKAAELGSLTAQFGEQVSLLGMYSAGEFFPVNFSPANDVQQPADGIHNVFHNSTVTLLAF
ncbi:MAG: FIST C-terminal domain-containing protein [Anaerovibrio sp.]